VSSHNVSSYTEGQARARALGRSYSVPRAALLGTAAKFQAKPDTKGFGPLPVSKIDPETGEISTVGPSGLSVRDAAECRLERFALQSVVRELLPNSRTAKCLRWRQKDKTVQVWKSKQYQRAHYKGLQTCSSVWTCPVCAAKISERRRVELETLISSHEKTGGVVLLVTRTFPHQQADILVDLLDQLAKADASYKAHRDYKTFAKSFGLVGSVRAVEVTYGVNGWHPHVHELLFLSVPVSLEDLEEDLFRIWQAAAVRAGFPSPSRAHGLQLQDGSKAAKYASKWGLESELTQWHRKRGKVDSQTPFDLLRRVFESQDKKASALFREYSESFHGRHQLQFSRGLKKLYSVAEISDDELTNKQDDEAVLLGSFTPQQWRLVCQTGQRGSLLEVATSSGWDAVLTLLESLARSCKDRAAEPDGPSL
jgi:hypothetical protein